ncbi:MAG: tyrosine-type recombinase/integrase [Alphaproteobacteria bacterium]|nr:tyrosine-type recombinase/integrase [Alphaproteobacteria bacterium]
MQMNKLNLTKKVLETLHLPSNGKRTYYYDTKVRGLGVSLTDKGSITFIVYRKVSGKPERITLGRYPDLSIENARAKAFEINSQIAQGKNPNHEKNKLRSELTFKELFNSYLERHAKLHKKSWENDEDQYRLYLSSWDKKKISSIKRSNIEALHAKVGKEHGTYAANRMLSLLGVMFNKAIDWGWEGINPAQGVKKFKEISRERFLAGDELPRFFKALEEENNRTLADFFMLGILTGARKGNLLSMRWQDINFNQATWRIPETKNGSSHLVPLSPEAINLLQERFKLKENEWVFRSATSKSGHLEEPKSAWKRILKKAELQDLRLHDLRRTLGSWQAATGANSYVIGKSLGHKTQQATAIYARLNIDPVRASVEKATSAMMSFGK